MGESIETELVVIAAHTGHPDTSERNILIGNMHDRVIDASSAGRCGADYLVTLFSEIVERQRLLPRAHEFRHLIDVRECLHREYRTENLFLHHRSIRTDIVQNSRLEISLSPVPVAAEYDVSIFQITLYALECLVIHKPYEMS